MVFPCFLFFFCYHFYLLFFFFWIGGIRALIKSGGDNVDTVFGNWDSESDEGPAELQLGLTPPSQKAATPSLLVSKPVRSRSASHQPLRKGKDLQQNPEETVTKESQIERESRIYRDEDEEVFQQAEGTHYVDSGEQEEPEELEDEEEGEEGGEDSEEEGESVSESDSDASAFEDHPKTPQEIRDLQRQITLMTELDKLQKATQAKGRKRKSIGEKKRTKSSSTQEKRQKTTTTGTTTKKLSAPLKTG